MSDAAEFLGPGVNVPFERARAVVLPVPLEASVSYVGGAGAGPRAILAASTQVELYDEQLEAEPCRAGIWTDEMLDTSGADVAAILARIEQRVGELLDAGKWVVILGGEHTVTPGAVAAAAGRHEGLTVIQLDAHADLRETYEGNRYSHACAMARCLEHAPVRGIGIRSMSRDEGVRIRDGIPGYAMLHAAETGNPGWIERALEGLDGRSVYLTLDVDYFDPSIVPATGTPEPGGGGWWETLELLSALFHRTNVVACDVVELAPAAGLHHADFTVARLVYKLLGLRFRSAPAGDC